MSFSDEGGGGYDPFAQQVADAAAAAAAPFADNQPEGFLDSGTPPDQRPERQPDARSFWDDQGSTTAQAAAEAAPTPGAPNENRTRRREFWDSAGNPESQAAPSEGGYQGAPTYVSPPEYNASEGEPPPFDIKEMETQARQRAVPPYTGETGQGATYVSPAAYNAFSDRRTFDLPLLDYEATNRRNQWELRQLWGGDVPQATGPSAGTFNPDVQLDATQINDLRNAPRPIDFGQPRAKPIGTPFTEGEGKSYWDDQGSPTPQSPEGYLDASTPPGAPPVDWQAQDRLRTADVPGGDLAALAAPDVPNSVYRANQAVDLFDDQKQQFYGKWDPVGFTNEGNSLNGERIALLDETKQFRDHFLATGTYDPEAYSRLNARWDNLDQRIQNYLDRQGQRVDAHGNPVGQYATDIAALDQSLETAKGLSALAAADINGLQAQAQARLSRGLQAGDESIGLIAPVVAQAQAAQQSLDRALGSVLPLNLVDQSVTDYQRQMLDLLRGTVSGVGAAVNATIMGPPGRDPNNPDDVLAKMHELWPAEGVYAQLYNPDGSASYLGGTYYNDARRAIEQENLQWVATHPQQAGLTGPLFDLGGFRPPTQWDEELARAMQQFHEITGILGPIPGGVMNYLPDVFTRSAANTMTGANMALQAFMRGDYGHGVLDTLRAVPSPFNLGYTLTGKDLFLNDLPGIRRAIGDPNYFRTVSYLENSPLSAITPKGLTRPYTSGPDFAGTNPVLPAIARATGTSQYDWFLWGGLQRAMDVIRNVPGTLLDPSAWKGSDLDPVALRNALASGMPMEEVQRRFAPSVGLQVGWNMANPGNFVGIPFVGEATSWLHALNTGAVEGELASKYGRMLAKFNNEASRFSSVEAPQLSANVARFTGGRSPEYVLSEVQRFLADGSTTLPTSYNSRLMLEDMQRSLTKQAAAANLTPQQYTANLMNMNTVDDGLRQIARNSGMTDPALIEKFVLENRRATVSSMILQLAQDGAALRLGTSTVGDLQKVRDLLAREVANRTRAQQLADAVRLSEGLRPGPGLGPEARGALIDQAARQIAGRGDPWGAIRYVAGTPMDTMRAGWLGLSGAYELGNLFGNLFLGGTDRAFNNVSRLAFSGKASQMLDRWAPILYPQEFMRQYGFAPNIGTSISEAVAGAQQGRNVFSRFGEGVQQTMTEAGQRAGRVGQVVRTPEAVSRGLIAFFKPVAEDMARYAHYHVAFHQAQNGNAAKFVEEAYRLFGNTPRSRALIDELVDAIAAGSITHPSQVSDFIARRGGWTGTGATPPPVGQGFAENRAGGLTQTPVQVPAAGMARGRPAGGPPSRPTAAGGYGGGRRPGGGPAGAAAPGPQFGRPAAPSEPLQPVGRQIDINPATGKAYSVAELRARAGRPPLAAPPAAPEAPGSAAARAVREADMNYAAEQLVREAFAENRVGGLTQTLHEAQAGGGVLDPADVMALYERVKARGGLPADRAVALDALTNQLRLTNQPLDATTLRNLTEAEAERFGMAAAPAAHPGIADAAEQLVAQGDFPIHPAQVQHIARAGGTGLGVEATDEQATQALQRALHQAGHPVDATTIRGYTPPANAPTDPEQFARELYGRQNWISRTALQSEWATATGTRLGANEADRIVDQMRAQIRGSNDPAAIQAQIRGEAAYARDYLANKWDPRNVGFVLPTLDWNDINALKAIAAEVIWHVRNAAGDAYQSIKELAGNTAKQVAPSDFIEEMQRVLGRDIVGAIPADFDYDRMYNLGKDKLAEMLAKSESFKGRTGRLRTVDEMMASITSGEQFRTKQQFPGIIGAGWYNEAPAALARIAGPDAEVLANIIAVTSSSQNPVANLRIALDFYREWKQTGRAVLVPGLTEDNFETLRHMFEDGWLSTGKWKTNTFAGNNLGIPGGVTADRWHFRWMGMPDKYDAALNWSDYVFAQQVGRRVAERLGITPQEAQAAGWIGIRQPKFGTMGSLGFADLIRDIAKLPEDPLAWMRESPDAAIRARYDAVQQDAALNEILPSHGKPWATYEGVPNAPGLIVPEGTYVVSGNVIGKPATGQRNILGPEGTPLRDESGQLLKEPYPQRESEIAAGRIANPIYPKPLPGRPGTTMQSLAEDLGVHNHPVLQRLQEQHAAALARINDRYGNLGIIPRSDLLDIPRDIRDAVIWAATGLALGAHAVGDLGVRLLERYGGQIANLPEKIPLIVQRARLEAEKYLARPVDDPLRVGRRQGNTAMMRAAYAKNAINVNEALDALRQAGEEANATGNIPLKHAVEDMLLDHRQASVGIDQDATARYHDLRAELMGPTTLDPVARARRRAEEMNTFLAENGQAWAYGEAAQQREAPTLRGGLPPRRADRTYWDDQGTPLLGAGPPAAPQLPEGAGPGLLRPGEPAYRPPQYNLRDTATLAGSRGVWLGTSPEQRAIYEQGALGTRQYLRGQPDVGALGTTPTAGTAGRYTPTWSSAQGEYIGPPIRRQAELDAQAALREIYNPLALGTTREGVVPTGQWRYRGGFDPNRPGYVGPATRAEAALDVNRIGRTVYDPARLGTTPLDATRGGYSPVFDPARAGLMRQDEAAWQAQLAQMLEHLPQAWRNSLHLSNADAFLASTKAFNNYGLQYKYIGNALGALAPFLTYHLRTPFRMAAIAAERPGLVSAYFRTNQVLDQAAQRDNPGTRASGNHKVFIGKYGVDLRDLIPMTRYLDAITNHNGIPDDDGVLRQDIFSKLARAYLDSGAGFGLWPWTDALLGAAGVTSPRLERTTVQPFVDIAGRAGQAVGLPQWVGRGAASILAPGSAVQAGIDALANRSQGLYDRLPGGVQSALTNTFPAGAQASTSLQDYYVKRAMENMVRQGQITEEEARQQYLNRGGWAWDAAQTQTRSDAQTQANIRGVVPLRIGERLPGEVELGAIRDAKGKAIASAEAEMNRAGQGYNDAIYTRDPLAIADAKRKFETAQDAFFAALQTAGAPNVAPTTGGTFEGEYFPGRNVWDPNRRTVNKAVDTEINPQTGAVTNTPTKANVPDAPRGYAGAQADRYVLNQMMGSVPTDPEMVARVRNLQALRELGQAHASAYDYTLAQQGMLDPTAVADFRRRNDMQIAETALLLARIDQNDAVASRNPQAIRDAQGKVDAATDRVRSLQGFTGPTAGMETQAVQDDLSKAGVQYIGQGGVQPQKALDREGQPSAHPVAENPSGFAMDQANQYVIRQFVRDNPWSPESIAMQDTMRGAAQKYGTSALFPQYVSQGDTEQQVASAYRAQQADILQNALETGTYLSPQDRQLLLDYNRAKTAYEGVTMVDPGTGQQVRVKDYLKTSQYYDLLDQLSAAKESGDTRAAQNIQGRLDQIKAVPAVTNYFNATGEAAKRDQMARLNLRRDDALLNPAVQAALAPIYRPNEYIDPATGERRLFPGAPGGVLQPRDQSARNVRADRVLYDQMSDSQRQAYQMWEDWKDSPDGQAYSAMLAAQDAAGPFGSAGEKAWYNSHRDLVTQATNARNAAIRDITARTGANPIDVSNQLGQIRYADFHPSNAAPKDLSLTGSGGTGSGGGSARGTGARTSRSRAGGGGGGQDRAQGAPGDLFYDYFKSITDRREKAAIYDALDRQGIRPFEKGTTDETYHRALAAARTAVDDVRKGRNQQIGSDRVTGTGTAGRIATRNVGGADAALIMAFGTSGARALAAQERQTGRLTPVTGINDLLPGGGRAQARQTQSGATPSGNASAGDAFYNWYNGLADRRTKAVALAALDRQNLNPVGKRNVSDQTYRRALAAGQAAVNPNREEPFAANRSERSRANGSSRVGVSLPGAAA